MFYVLHVDGNGVVVVEPLCYLLGAVHRSVLAAGTAESHLEVCEMA